MMPRLDNLVPSESFAGPGKQRDLGGLLGLTQEGERPFPLREVKVRAAIAGDCCRTVVEQRFANPYDVGLEAVHIFPLPEDGAVTEMELQAGNVVVRAECRERQQAEQTFRQAREEGRRAALLTQERADVHTLRVTNIPPKTEILVRLVIVERLEQADGRLRWRFPTVIAPRYTPGEPIGHDGEGTVPDTDRVPDASRLQPPLRLAGGTTLDLEVMVNGPIAALESSLHAVGAELGEQVRVAPSTRATLNKDFVLRFAYGRAEEASARAFTDGQFTLLLVDPPLDLPQHTLPRDVVFVIDISGSMSGVKLQAAKRALATALRGLEAGDRFRLIAFDNRIQVFCPEFVNYTQESQTRADGWIQSLRARGGTEILQPLLEALSGETSSGRLRTVILVTDGQVTNEPELFQAVISHRRNLRLFTVGIDTAVNAALLKRLARAGGGTCELLTPRDNIEEAIIGLDARFGSPLITDLLVEAREAARPEPTDLFAGRSASFLVRGSPGEIRVSGRATAGPCEYAARPATIDFPLGALWARQRVAWLEDRLIAEPRDKQKLEAEMKRIALEHGIASRFTAFVAMETVRSHDGERVTVVQPVELPEEWSEAFLRASPRAVSCERRRSGGARRMVHFSGIMPAASDLERLGQILSRARAGEQPPPGASDLVSGVLRDAGTPLDSLCSIDSVGFDEDAARREKAREDQGLGVAVVQSQASDGSFGGDVGRTAAAVMTLLLLGSTRRTGVYRRFIMKAVKWLQTRLTDARAVLAVGLVERVEAGGSGPVPAEVKDLLACLPEGRHLKTALDSLAPGI